MPPARPRGRLCANAGVREFSAAPGRAVFFGEARIRFPARLTATALLLDGLLPRQRLPGRQGAMRSAAQSSGGGLRQWRDADESGPTAWMTAQQVMASNNFSGSLAFFRTRIWVGMVTGFSSIEGSVDRVGLVLPEAGNVLLAFLRCQTVDVLQPCWIIWLGSANVLAFYRMTEGVLQDFLFHHQKIGPVQSFDFSQHRSRKRRRSRSRRRSACGASASERRAECVAVIFNGFHSAKRNRAFFNRSFFNALRFF